MVNRLIAFGCSFTYGHGLPDCTIGEKTGPAPSQLGWPAILGNMLNSEVINLGVPGASNLEILYHLLNFEFKENDTAVIMWSFPFRDLYFRKQLFSKKRFRQLKVWLNHPVWRKLWKPDGGEEDYAVRTWLYMHHASLFLRSNNIKHLHFPAVPKEIIEYQPSYIQIPNLSLDGIEVVDVADKQGHPGLKSNQFTAEKIYKLLNE